MGSCQGLCSGGLPDSSASSGLCLRPSASCHHAQMHTSGWGKGWHSRSLASQEYVVLGLSSIRT